MNTPLHAITGITGQVGGALARTLLANGQRVRAVVRDVARAEPWATLGCEVAVANLDDAAALTAAFSGCDGVFVLPPPTFDPQPGFPALQQIRDAVAAALLAAQPQRVVCLSTIGAQAQQHSLLTQLQMMEEGLRGLPLPIVFLRAGWFIENAAWDVAGARDEGRIESYLQPLHRAIPMVATADVGRVAAELLQQAWQGARVVELEGPVRVSPQDLAAAFARVLQRPVQVQAVPRDGWHARFHAQGMHNPQPRMRMLDGFNEGWIDFEGDAGSIQRGEVDVETVLRGLLAAAGSGS